MCLLSLANDGSEVHTAVTKITSTIFSNDGSTSVSGEDFMLFVLPDFPFLNESVWSGLHGQSSNATTLESIWVIWVE